MSSSGRFFVTGTDTGVGKTLVSALLVHQLKATGRSVAYMKPVQTGCIRSSSGIVAPDVEFVHTVNDSQAPDDLNDAICPYRLLLPASPHLAAEQEGVTIHRERILAAFDCLQSRHDHCVVEGAGGILVPLTRDFLMLDLMKALALPVIVVCRPSLGTLNHTFMTLQLIRDAGLTVYGLVVVHTTPPSSDPADEVIISDNHQTLEQLGQTAILACLPYVKGLENPQHVRAWLKDSAPHINGLA